MSPHEKQPLLYQDNSTTKYIVDNVDKILSFVCFLNFEELEFFNFGKYSIIKVTHYVHLKYLRPALTVNERSHIVKFFVDECSIVKLYLFQAYRGNLAHTLH